MVSGASDASPVYRIPTSDQGPEYFAGVPQDGIAPLCLVMVGLPARGKTVLAQKLARLLGWHGITSTVFNLQVKWKRQMKQSYGLDPDTPMIAPADLFEDMYRPGTTAHQVFGEVLNEIAQSAAAFFDGGGSVAIFNDDFITSGSRKEIVDCLNKAIARTKSPLPPLVAFIEVQRDPTINGLLTQCKVRDPEEYPENGVVATDGEESTPATSLGNTFTEVPQAIITPRREKSNTTSAAPPPAGEPQDALGVPPLTRAPSASAVDFAKRLALLEPMYETLTESSGLSYVKIKNNAVLEIHQVRGYLFGRIINYIMNLLRFNVQHPIYFARHGQSEYNIEDRLGGNPELTDKGRHDAQALYEFIKMLKEHEELKSAESTECGDSTSAPPVIEIWTSQLKRAMQTAEPAVTRLGIKCLRWSSLNEIHAGVCEDMTYGEVDERYPLISHFRAENKYRFRYPSGESYQDLVNRLEPVIMELENSNRIVVVIAHQAVLRGLLAYFCSSSAEASVKVEVPHRTVWRCSYDSKGIARVDRLSLGVPANGDGSKD